MNTDVMFSSKTDDWATPQDFFDKLHEEFQFTLDVCASESNAKCSTYFTKEEDGLSNDWFGNVWCNPPYGRTIGHWVKKAYEYALGGGLRSCCSRLAQILAGFTITFTENQKYALCVDGYGLEKQPLLRRSPVWLLFLEEEPNE